MSFVGVIDSDKHKLMWSRSILSLAAISEHIKFHITRSAISISAVNTAKITHAEIAFKNSFFHEYLVNFVNVVPEGFCEDEVDFDLSSYSFVINSRHLAVLFKNLDPSDLEYICFKINWQRDCPSTMKFKFLIEIKTRKLIIKKYQTSYQPIVTNKLNVSSTYKQHLFDQQHHQTSSQNHQDIHSAVKYIMMEQIIPKQFLDMIPSSTEDFKIDIKRNRLSLSGYTKQVLKDKEFLKQPMSITITLSLDELINSNLNDFTPANDNDDIQHENTMAINFRLKDFKNFINLITSFSTSSSTAIGSAGMGENNGYTESVTDITGTSSGSESDAFFEIYFKNPGDPIMFELQSYPHILVQYTQITSDDNFEMPPGNTIANNDSANNLSTAKRTKFALPSHSVVTAASTTNSILQPVIGQSALTSKQIANPSLGERLPQPLPGASMAARELTYDYNADDFNTGSPAPAASKQSSDLGLNADRITYGRKPSETDQLAKRQKLANSTSASKTSNMENTASVAHNNRTVESEDTDYGNSDSDEEINKGDEQHELVSTQVLGPTQLDGKPKSIFD